MNNQPKGEAVSTGHAVPMYRLWVCPQNGVWDAAWSGPYADCWAHALTFAPISDTIHLTIQPISVDPNQD